MRGISSGTLPPLSLPALPLVTKRSTALCWRSGASDLHLNRPVAYELHDGAQIDSGHYKFSGKGVPVAMPSAYLTLDASTAGSNQALRPRSFSPS